MQSLEDRADLGEIEDVKEWRVADFVSDAVERGTNGIEKTGDVFARLPYVLIGSAALGLQNARESLQAAARMPRKLARATLRGPGRLAAGVRRAPQRLSREFEERENEGRKVIDRVFGRTAVHRVGGRIRNAEARAKAAKTSATRAVRASGRAAKAVAEAVVDPRDTRPYEERTREELYELAGERNVAGRSGMKKSQLIKALRAMH